MGEDWEIQKNAPGEETLIKHENGEEFDLKTLRNNLPDLEEHIKALELEGWHVSSRGPMFVVMERTQTDQKEETTH